MATSPTHLLLRQAYRSDLSDVQWKRVRRLLPKPKGRGRPRANEREVLNGILYVLSTGCRWEDLPHDIDASYQTCNRRLLDYQKRRVWQKMLGELMKEAARKGLLNLKNAYHDASVVKSKRGRKPKSDTQGNTGFAASNATWSSRHTATR
jgi:transposase